MMNELAECSYLFSSIHCRRFEALAVITLSMPSCWASRMMLEQHSCHMRRSCQVQLESNRDQSTQHTIPVSDSTVQINSIPSASVPWTHQYQWQLQACVRRMHMQQHLSCGQPCFLLSTCHTPLDVSVLGPPCALPAALPEYKHILFKRCLHSQSLSRVMAHLHCALLGVSSVVTVKPSYGQLQLALFSMLCSLVVLLSLLELSSAHKPSAGGYGSDSGSRSGPGGLIPGIGSGLFPGKGPGSAGLNPRGGGLVPGGGGSGPEDVFPKGWGAGKGPGRSSYGHRFKCAKTCEWWESNYKEIIALSKGHATSSSTPAQAIGDAALSIFGGGKSLLGLLKDKSEDGFSQLGRQGAAAYLNSLSSPSFQYTPDQVKSLFSAALASKETALKQSRLFENANFKLKIPKCH